MYRQSAHRRLYVIHPAVGSHYFLPGPWLPSQPQSITASWPVSSYTAWWQRHISFNNLPKVVTQLKRILKRSHQADTDVNRSAPDSSTSADGGSRMQSITRQVANVITVSTILQYHTNVQQQHLNNKMIWTFYCVVNLHCTYTNHVTPIWNSLSDYVVSAKTVNTFKRHLNKFWSDQDVLFTYKADLHGSINCSTIV